MPSARDSNPERSVLFLYSETGGGHRTAAQAIDTELHRLASPHGEPLRTRLVDAVAVCGEFPLRESIISYGTLLNVRPSPYAAIYHLSDGRKRYRVFGELGKPFIRRKFRRLIEETKPDLVVSVHPLLNVLARETLDALGSKARLITVITDLVTIHHSWTAAGVSDHYFVPSPEAFEVCLERDIPFARLHDFGLPIRDGFWPPAGDRSKQKAALGLNPRAPTLLVMAGGEGRGLIPRMLPELAPLFRSLSIEAVIVAGRNARLRRRLSKMSALLESGATILGFVENIAEYMRAADALLTKAGPGTIAEAAASGLPVMIADYVAGQEFGNLDYVQRRGSGVVALETPELAAVLARLFGDGGDELARLRHRALASARPSAARDVAEFLLGLLKAV